MNISLKPIPANLGGKKSCSCVWTEKYILILNKIGAMWYNFLCLYPAGLVENYQRERAFVCTHVMLASWTQWWFSSVRQQTSPPEVWIPLLVTILHDLALD